MNWLKFRRKKFDSLSRPFHTRGTNCPSNLSSSGTVLTCCAPLGPSSPPAPSGAYARPKTVSLGAV